MSSDRDAHVRNLKARAFWISQGLSSRTASALADYGVHDIGQLSSMGRAALSFVPDLGEIGMEAVEKLLSRRLDGHMEAEREFRTRVIPLLRAAIVRLDSEAHRLPRRTNRVHTWKVNNKLRNHR